MNVFSLLTTHHIDLCFGVPEARTQSKLFYVESDLSALTTYLFLDNNIGGAPFTGWVVGPQALF